MVVDTWVLFLCYYSFPMPESCVVGQRCLIKLGDMNGDSYSSSRPPRQLAAFSSLSPFIPLLVKWILILPPNKRNLFNVC